MDFLSKVMKYLIAGMFCIGTVPAAAQGNIAVGVKGGYSSSTFNGEDADNVDRREGFSAGAFAKFSPKPWFAIQPEVLFRQKGGTNTHEALEIREEYKLDYLETPLLLKLRLPVDNVFFPHIYAGPYYAFKINDEYQATQADAGTQIRDDLAIRKSDYGAVLGAGVDIESRRFFVSMEVRYGIGAQEIEDENVALDLQNRDWQLIGGIGYIFGKETEKSSPAPAVKY